MRIDKKRRENITKGAQGDYLHCACSNSTYTLHISVAGRWSKRYYPTKRRGQGVPTRVFVRSPNISCRTIPSLVWFRWPVLSMSYALSAMVYLVVPKGRVGHRDTTASFSNPKANPTCARLLFHRSDVCPPDLL